MNVSKDLIATFHIFLQVKKKKKENNNNNSDIYTCYR